MSDSERYNSRRKQGLPIDKNDFIFLLQIHDEFAFKFKGLEYDITWNYDKKTKETKLCFSLDIFDGYHAKEYQFYDTIEEFIACAKIDNRLVVDMVDDLIF